MTTSSTATRDRMFDKFIEQMQKMAAIKQSSRIIMGIQDITTGDNSLNFAPDSVGLILTQEYGYRLIDQAGASSRSENSPMSAPLLFIALQGGGSCVNLCNAFWSGTTLAEIVISRLHETGGTTDASYKITYTTSRIISSVEVLVEGVWCAAFMLQVGEVKKEHKIAGLDGAFGGSVAANKNFLTGTA